MQNTFSLKINWYSNTFFSLKKFTFVMNWIDYIICLFAHQSLLRENILNWLFFSLTPKVFARIEVLPSLRKKNIILYNVKPVSWSEKYYTHWNFLGSKVILSEWKETFFFQSLIENIIKTINESVMLDIKFYNHVTNVGTLWEHDGRKLFLLALKLRRPWRNQDQYDFKS